MIIDAFVPVTQWGKDHWSTLAYIETIIVEKSFYLVKLDPRMRSSRRTYRILAESPTNRFVTAVPMLREHATILLDGSTITNHDDWCCLQDAAEAGLLNVFADGVTPGAKLKLSALGQRAVAELRKHKQAGGSFGGFEWKP